MTGSSNNNHWIVPALVSSGMSVTAILGGYWAFQQHEKYLRSKWLDEEDERQLLQQKERRAKNNEGDSGESDQDASDAGLYSVIGHFKSLELDSTSTILEANRRRTTSYYEKAREAHEQSLVLGIPSYSKLIQKRKKALDSLLFNHREGKKSLRTVIVMLDNLTQNVLSEARQKILQPLNYSWDIYHKGVWIPEINMIPNEDMHVTVACPWWWHTMREGNDELNEDLSNRLKQALLIDFHHPFFLELERFVFLGGKTLVALWRTVGERSVLEEGDDPIVVCDRHATTIDPMVRLRKEIVDCFTNDQHEHNLRPLTHHHLVADTKTIASPAAGGGPAPPPPLPKPNKIVRTHTIESKTPGLGSGDGFIHTTLCRLPLECFSSKDVELEPIHRLCREATATYSGHRMLVHKFRFVETTGEGGDSNPCKNPRFDCTLEAPLKVNSDELPFVAEPEAEDLPVLRTRALTTGRAAGLRLQARREGLEAPSVGMPRSSTSGGLDGLFDPPKTN